MPWIWVFSSPTSAVLCPVFRRGPLPVPQLSEEQDRRRPDPALGQQSAARWRTVRLLDYRLQFSNWSGSRELSEATSVFLTWNGLC